MVIRSYTSRIHLGFYMCVEAYVHTRAHTHTNARAHNMSMFACALDVCARAAKKTCLRLTLAHKPPPRSPTTEKHIQGKDPNVKHASLGALAFLSQFRLGRRCC